MCMKSRGTNNPNWGRPSKSQHFFFPSFPFAGEEDGGKCHMWVWVFRRRSDLRHDEGEEVSACLRCRVRDVAGIDKIKILDRTNVGSCENGQKPFFFLLVVGINANSWTNVKRRVAQLYFSFIRASREWLKVSTCRYCRGIPLSNLLPFQLALSLFYCL